MNDSLVGHRLDEYQIITLLGQGGMARVYLGRDVRLKRYVAIKVIDRPYRSDEQYIQRFEREAQAVAQLEHPHIVRLYRYGETDELFYMAMQYVEGADLAAILASYKAEGTLIPPGDALRIVKQVAQALDYAHSRGVIHRDVKPANIVLDKSGTAYLTDFGLALFAESGTVGETFGTPQYIAPEQARSSSRAVPQSDLYALGIALYEMFSGELPFSGGPPLEVALRQIREEPRPPREVRPDLSPEVEAVILKALAKEPSQRYQSGAALVTALDSALAQAPATSPIMPEVGLLRTLPQRVSHAVAEEEALTDLRHVVDSGLPATGPLASQPLTPSRTPVAVRPPRQRRTPLVAGCLGGVILLALLLAFGLSSLFGGNGQNGLSLPLVTGEQEEPTAEAIVTPTLGALPPPTEEPQPEPSATTEPDPTPLPALSTPPEPAAPTARLLLVPNKEDSIFIVNVGSSAIDLDELVLGDGRRKIEGDDWDISSLRPGQCVTAWKEEGQPEPPRVQCQEVGDRIYRKGPERFWDRDYNVYYDDTLLATCKRREECPVELPISAVDN